MSTPLFENSPCSGEGWSVGSPIYRSPPLRPWPEHNGGAK